MRTSYVLLLLLVASAVVAAGQETSRADIALGYAYTHDNAPPAGCSCFSMNGFNGNVAWHVKPAIALVGELGVTHASNIFPAGHDLTLTSYLFGPRFYYMRKSAAGELQPPHAFTPFGQFLIGGAHASGSLSGSSSGSSNGFAFATGGGIDLGLSRRLAWRMFQTEWLHTGIPNGVNDRQNNFRFITGLVIRLGQR